MPSTPTRTPSLLALAFVVPLGLACDTMGPSACLDGVSFTVGTGTEPTVDWKPSCRMQSLVFRAVIRYGEIPPNAFGPMPAPALAQGTGYRLTLYASFNDPTGGATQQAVDSVVFVP
jgi:hypothetical protein